MTMLLLLAGAIAAGEPAPPSWYRAQIEPIFAAHCVACHGEGKAKAGLRLHTPDAIRGAIDDEIMGDLLERIGLPLDDDDHMPPDGKPQLATWQVDTLARWIEAGAPLPTTPERPKPVVFDLPIGAITKLLDARVHVEVVDPDANLLWVDFTARADMKTDEMIRLLEPVAQSTTELSLRGIENADEVLTACAPWTNLRKLDLARAHVSYGGLAAASRVGRLVELKLIEATITAEAAEDLTRVKSLERIHTWGSNLPDSVLATLAGRDVVNAGSIEVPDPVEVEPEFVSGKPKTAVTSIEPVNTACPVSVAPIDPKYMVVHDGKVVAFCCEKCGAKFWEDPAKYAIKE